MAATLLTLATLLATAQARSQILEKAATLPPGWDAVGSGVDPSQSIQFSIGLRQPSVQSLASQLQQHSDHISQDDVRSYRAPKEQDVSDVLKWLTSNGIKDAEAKDDWVHVKTTIGNAETLLDAKFQHYSFRDQVSAFRAQQYSVPEHLSEAISFVHPISNFMAPWNAQFRAEQLVPTANKAAQISAMQQDAANKAFCASGVTPSCLKKLYNIESYQPADNSSDSRLGISGYLLQNSNHHDVDAFLQKQAPELAEAHYNFTVELLNGGQDPQAPGTAGQEAVLDLEYGMGTGYPSKVIFYATGGFGVQLGDDGKPSKPVKPEDGNEPYLEFVEAMLNKSDDELPHVLSVSYADDELSVPQPYAQKVCNLLGLLTKRGTTIIHASGDGGSAGGGPGSCLSKDGKGRQTTIATFPPSCPWVTSVGAVSHYNEPPAGAGFSSGGFSEYFGRPAWQEDEASAYIKTLNGHLKGYYNASGRAIPDVAVVGTSFATIVNGLQASSQGTSASAPVFAAMIGLVNDARLREGKKSLGFINELLYSEKVKSVLQDITKGQSMSCSFNGTRPGGWPASKGWDAMTGLGVPKDFAKLLDVLKDA